MLTSEATTNRSTHVVKDKCTGRLRKITPIEAERLNCFPDNWTNTGMTTRQRYFMMGNALVTGIIKILGKELEKIFNEED
jgi:DNA (cytosine-5)-methyltransferase 1